MLDVKQELKKSKRHTIGDKCPRCGRNLEKGFYGNRQRTICQHCQMESIRLAQRQQAINGTIIVNDRKTREMLTKNSIISDSKLKNANFANFKPEVSPQAFANFEKAQKIAEEYIRNPDKSFNTLILGNAGRGKSHLAMAIIKQINQFCLPRPACLFADFSRVVSLVKSTFGSYGSNSQYTEDGMIKRLGEPDYLVIDDLGSEATMQSKGSEASNYTQQLLFQIMQKRQGKSTIFTSNLTNKQLEETYNEKLISRIQSGIGSQLEHVIVFSQDTPDYRTKGATNGTSKSGS